jgi:hypothetical protein
VAVARKLAVIMHAMWRDGAAYTDRPHAGGACGDARADRQGAQASERPRMTYGALQPPTGARLNALRRSATADEDWCRPWNAGSTLSCLWPERS